MKVPSADTESIAVRSASRGAVEERSAGAAARRPIANSRGQNPQGGTAISIWAKSDLGAGKLEFLQGTPVVSTMDVEVKAGMNRFQWNMRGPAPAFNGGRGGGGRGPVGPGVPRFPPASADRW